jgi:Uma2 family endonuclease
MAITKFSQLDLTKQYTYADYLTWQFAERVELLKGWVMKMAPGPSEIHQRSSFYLENNIYNYFAKKPCKVYHAPFDVRLVKVKKNLLDTKIHTVVQPDILVVCDRGKLDAKGVIGAPDLVVEILSPGNSKKEMKTKFELYETNGVLEYWIVNPQEKSIHLFYLENKKYQLDKIYFDDDKMESKIFKGLKVKVGEVFEG